MSTTQTPKANGNAQHSQRGDERAPTILADPEEARKTVIPTRKEALKRKRRVLERSGCISKRHANGGAKGFCAQIFGSPRPLDESNHSFHEPNVRGKPFIGFNRTLRFTCQSCLSLNMWRFRARSRSVPEAKQSRISIYQSPSYHAPSSKPKKPVSVSRAKLHGMSSRKRWQKQAPRTSRTSRTSTRGSSAENKELGFYGVFSWDMVVDQEGGGGCRLEGSLLNPDSAPKAP